MDASQKSCFGRCFRVFDYFGVNFTFRIKDDPKYKSNCGGIIFIFFLFQALVYFFITFGAFWERNTYTINYSVTVTKPAPEINFFKSGFNFAYSLQYDNDTFIDPKDISFLKQSLILTKLQNSDMSTKNKTTLELKPCEIGDFYHKLNQTEFGSLNLNKFNCAKLTDDVSIQGTFADPVYKYLELGILINDAAFTHNPNVSINLDYMQKFFDENPIKIVVYWIDTTVNVRDYDNPISNYIRTYISYVDFYNVKKSNMDFSVLQFSSDSNYIIQDQEHQNNVTFHQAEDFSLDCNDRLPLGNLGKTMVKYFFRSAPSNTIMDRSYQKLTQFLANFGGLQSNMLVALLVVVSFLNTFWAEQKIMNRMLKFREHLKVSHPKQYELLKANLRSNSNLNDADKNINDRTGPFNDKDFEVKIKDTKSPLEYGGTDQMDVPLTNEVPVERTLSVHHRNIKERKPVELEIEEQNTLSKSKKPISFSSFEIFCRSCPCKPKALTLKNKLYEKASKKLNYYFDIFSYVKKMQEIDIMKYLLLDKDQTKLFNFLSKPSISMAYSDSDDIYQSVQKNNVIKSKLRIDELEEIIKSYKQLKGKDDSLNSKLFYLFDYEIDHLLIG